MLPIGTKRLFGVLVIAAAVLLPTTPASAGPAVAAPSASGTLSGKRYVPGARSVAKDVAIACETLRHAMIRADKRQMQALMSPRMSFGHSNGVVQTRAEFMAAVLGRKEVFKKIDLTGRRIRVTGPTAVVRQRFAAEIDLDGKPLSVKLDELQVWQRSAGKWQLLARQAFKS